MSIDRRELAAFARPLIEKGSKPHVLSAFFFLARGPFGVYSSESSEAVQLVAFHRCRQLAVFHNIPLHSTAPNLPSRKSKTMENLLNANFFVLLLHVCIQCSFDSSWHSVASIKHQLPPGSILFSISIPCLLFLLVSKKVKKSGARHACLYIFFQWRTSRKQSHLAALVQVLKLARISFQKKRSREELY